MKFKIGDVITFKEKNEYFEKHHGVEFGKIYKIIKITEHSTGDQSIWINNPRYDGSWWSGWFKKANSEYIKQRLGVK